MAPTAKNSAVDTSLPSTATMKSPFCNLPSTSAGDPGSWN